jgi:hypothetical protein
MERIEDPHARIFRAQGIVGVDGITRMFTAWFQPVVSHPIINVGFTRVTRSSFR